MWIADVLCLSHSFDVTGGSWITHVGIFLIVYLLMQYVFPVRSDDNGGRVGTEKE